MTTTFRYLRRAVMLAAACLMMLGGPAAAQSTSVADLAIDVRPERKIYTLGEYVNLDVRIANRSAGAVSIPAGTDVWTGNVEVFIASGTGDYVQYTGPGWGLRDAMGDGTRILEPGRAWTTQATILYNHGVKTDHLSPAARAELRGRLLHSGFAIRTPGSYRIKVRVHGTRSGDVTDSDAVEIAITEPEGVDRLVWNALNTAPDAAYFLHAGGPRSHPQAPASLAIVDSLQRLAAAYPSSRYAAAIQNRLAAYDTALERLWKQGLVSP